MVDTNMTSKALHVLFKKIWTSEEMPNDWKHGHLIKLPKKGNLKECPNWRGITLLSVPGKVFSRILLERIKIEVEKEHVLRDEQAGFRQEQSTTDQSATLRNIIEQSLEWNTTLYTILWTLKRPSVAWIETHCGSCWPTMTSRRRSLS